MIRAVIFDLDNTLFNTTGQLYVQARRKACKAMVKAGIPATEQGLYSRMQELYRQCGPFSHVVLQKLLDEFSITGQQRQHVLAEAEKAYNAVNVSGITLYPGVRDMLERLKKRYKLALLTSGWPEQQNKKISALGIKGLFELVIFDNIKGGQESRKDAAIQQALKAFEVDAEETACVGDRIGREIAAGNKLGLITIRVLQGSYSVLQARTKGEEPNFTVKHTVEVEDVLESLENASPTPAKTL